MGEDEFDEVRKMINRMLADAVEGKVAGTPDPIAREFSEPMNIRDDEKQPLRRYLVRVPQDHPGLPGPDIEDTNEAVYVTVDLGGMAPTAVHTRLAGRLLLVAVDGVRPMERVVELPHEVEPNVRWTVRDGVIDLTLTRRHETDSSS